MLYLSFRTNSNIQQFERVQTKDTATLIVALYRSLLHLWEEMFRIAKAIQYK